LLDLPVVFLTVSSQRIGIGLTVRRSIIDYCKISTDRALQMVHLE